MDKWLKVSCLVSQYERRKGSNFEDAHLQINESIVNVFY